MDTEKCKGLIDKHLIIHKTDPRFASIQYYAESGKVSGELYLRLKALIAEVEETTRNEASDISASIISCFLKDAAKNNKEYSKITIQMRDNDLQVQGHTAIPYGQSWGKWLVKESKILNNL